MCVGQHISYMNVSCSNVKCLRPIWPLAWQQCNGQSVAIIQCLTFRKMINIQPGQNNETEKCSSIFCKITRLRVQSYNVYPSKSGVFFRKWFDIRRNISFSFLVQFHRAKSQWQLWSLTVQAGGGEVWGVIDSDYVCLGCCCLAKLHIAGLQFCSTEHVRVQNQNFQTFNQAWR